ncbi:Ankyrin repeat and EF-hand domain-containing protein 1 [Lonchura striata]|uniref:Ankyrin repeat and EF-hand domain-containing protein 1 n=1 Tax=Lonchura striata TaxID=40157 RepID=A0A218V6Y1_9PASE|nr:Ankyrin repeat and EF-hand domain-containing protein 1 [Lonchura striata domestica]
MAAAEASGDPAAAPEPSASSCSSESTSLEEDNLPYPERLPVDKRLLNLQIYKLLQCVHEKDKKQIENLIQKGFPDLINYTEPKEGYSAFHVASMKNDIEMCRFLLEHGAHPNVHDNMGRTPAMKAAELGYEVILELLAKANADMTAVDNEGKGRHSHCLQIALEYGADVNNCTTTGRSVLLQACEQAHEVKEMCLIFLEKGADPHAKDPATGRTAVMEAAREGAVEVVLGLLRRGADVNLFDFERHSAAHFAAKGGFLEILAIISGYGADLKLIAMNGNTPLHYAAEGGFTDCCRYIGQRGTLKLNYFTAIICILILISQTVSIFLGCDPTWSNLANLTPREVAKSGGFKAAAAVLRKAEKAFKKPDEILAWYLKVYDWSLQHEDAIRKEFEIDEEGDGMVSRNDFMSVIRKQWGSVDEEQIEILTKKHEVSTDRISLDDFFKGSKYLQKTFLLSSFGPKAKKKKKPQKKKGKKGLPVPICVIPKSERPLREDGFPTYMVEAVPNISEEQRFKRALQSAHPVLDDRAWYVEEPRKTLMDINYLVREGDFVSLQKAFDEAVPVDIKDKYYKTPLMVACASGNIVLVEFLLEKGADVNATDNFLWTPLHHACYNGHLDIAKVLVKAGAAVNAPAIGGATPLMRAIEACRLDMVYFLITTGADVQAINSNGKSVLDLAQVFEDATIIELLENQLQILAEEQEKEEAKPAKGGKPKPAEPPKPVKKEIWSPDATAMELAEKRELLCERAALCGHMEDFTTLFNRKFKK